MTTHDIQRGKILFIDDDERVIASYIKHLKQEGFSNTTHISEVNSFAQISNERADLVFLDITGVAANLSPTDQGIALLKYLRKEEPWTRVVVLSGSAFEADKTHDLGTAHVCVKKASLGLAGLRELATEQLRLALAPEHRNTLVLTRLLEQVDNLSLSWWRKGRLKKIARTAIDNEGRSDFDWRKLVETAKPIIAGAKAMQDLANLLVT